MTSLQLPDELYVGLFTCSHIHDNLQTAVIQDVRITIPAKADFIPYTDYIGSNLEILDVETGRREIVYHVSDSLQAPIGRRTTRRSSIAATAACIASTWPRASRC